MRDIKSTLSFIARGLLSTKRVVLAQIVPMRRCNLSCTYCNEFDKVSNPVPLEEVKKWIDKLAEFRTMNITISGGEPMMHPEIYEIISYIRSKNIMAGLITNGYYLTEETIKKLNQAGLQDLQISIDNVEPDKTSAKSLNYYEKKRGTLELLKEFAKFNVNINSVVGSNVEKPEDALIITKRAFELGFSSTVGIIHDENGLIKKLEGKEKDIYDEIIKISARNPFQYGWYSKKFQKKLLKDGESKWRCRSGSRYLYICEHGRVQWCSQQRICKKGKPHGETIISDDILDIPLEDYSWEEFNRQFLLKKGCDDECTIQCVRLVGRLDNTRYKQMDFEEYNNRIGN